MQQIVHKFILFLMLCSLSGLSFAVDINTSKIRIGLKLFRTILAADQQIMHKQNKNGQLSLVIVYKNNKQQALNYADKLLSLGKGKNQGKVKQIPLQVITVSIADLQQLKQIKPAGLYLVEELELGDIKALIDYGIDYQRITYSPFSRHIEYGISAGLMIEARVKPYINLQTLTASRLQLKSFFLKVAKIYEP